MDTIDMTRLPLLVPHSCMSEWIDYANTEGLELGQFIGWACDTVIRLRLVPLRSALRCRVDKSGEAVAYADEEQTREV